MIKTTDKSLIYCDGAMFNEHGFVILCPETCLELAEFVSISTWSEFAEFAYDGWLDFVEERILDGYEDDDMPAPEDAVDLMSHLEERYYDMMPDPCAQAASVLSRATKGLEIEGMEWKAGRLGGYMVTASSIEAIEQLGQHFDTVGLSIRFERDDSLATQAFGQVL
jgi:hypothetical protein